MSHNVTTLAFSMFLSAVLCQLLVWHTLIIRKAILSLIVLFTLTPVVLLFFLWDILGVNSFDLIYATTLYIFLASSYVQSYPVFQANDIPSFRILRLLNTHAPNPLTKDEIVRILARDHLFSDKLEDLIRDGLLSLQGNVLVLTPAGRLIVRAFAAYRKCLGLKTGTG